MDGRLFLHNILQTKKMLGGMENKHFSTLRIKRYSKIKNYGWH